MGAICTMYLIQHMHLHVLVMILKIYDFLLFTTCHGLFPLGLIVLCFHFFFHDITFFFSNFQCF